MLSLAEFEPWWRFGFALLIGALIGLEREFHQQKEEIPDFAGIRTYSLIALLGAVSSFLIANYGIIPAAIALSGLIVLTAISYAGNILRKKIETGITTEVAAILTFFFGILVVIDQPLVAVSLAVLTSLLLALKGRLHGFIRGLSAEDIYLTLEFALVAAVILPVLPNRAIDPLGLLNPFQIWLMVVLVSGIGFSGFVLIKVLGPTRGINLMGILGGLASSTVTTLSFSSASKQHPDLAPHYARAAVLASSVMFPRVFILVLVLYPPLAVKILVPLAAMLLAGIFYMFVLQRRGLRGKAEVPPEFEFTNPLKLSTAVKFGLLFALVLIVVEIAQTFLGISGVYLASFLTGLTDVDAITLSLTGRARQGQLALDVAVVAVIIAALMNTVSKAAISYSSGSPEFSRPVIKAYLFILLAGILSGAITIFLL
jgi:uncharacterized membrane protein (DUF4010 family)